MTLRVIQWTTGFVGRHALRQIIESPELELAGVRVTSAAKQGLDAGALCGLADTGILATQDVDALLALDADCVCYMAADPQLSDPTIPGSHGEQLLAEICRILESGKNVVSTSLIPLIWPPAGWHPAVQRIERACASGGVSFRCCGVQPGMVNDGLASFMSAASQSIDRLRMQTLSDWGAVNKAEMLGARGFGLTPGEFEERHPGGSLGDEAASDWVREAGTMIRIVADNLQAPLESITGTARIWILPEEATPSPDILSGIVRPGTVCAQHVTVAGRVHGRDRILLERIVRLGPRPAADFPSLAQDRMGYRVIFEGRPDMTIEIVFGDGQDPRSYGAMTQMATAAIAVNTIPALCAAPPGFHTHRTLPLIVAQGMRWS